MSWEFDHHKVMVTLADIINEIVGDRLAVLPFSGGKKAIFLAHYAGVTPPLPHVLLTYQGSRDDDGVIIERGLVEVEVDDPNNPPNTILVNTEYLDKLVNFNISIRAESMPPTAIGDNTNAHWLLREIRKGLLLPKYRKTLRDNVFTSIEFINTIRSTPDLISTAYHEIVTMQLKLSSVDRVIDYETQSFDTVDWTGTVTYDDDYPDPIILTGSVTSNIP